MLILTQVKKREMSFCPLTFYLFKQSVTVLPVILYDLTMFFLMYKTEKELDVLSGKLAFKEILITGTF